VDGPSDITVVLPTYNRARALEENFHSTLALEGVREIIVVDDGSVDDTRAVLAGFSDDRVRVVTQLENRGAPAARNLGAQLATTEWVVYGEDDCRFPSDYAVVLRAEADAHGADIVGAPWVHAGSEEDVAAVVAARRARGDGRVGIESVDIFPPAPIVTPFVPARALVRRAVFDHVQWDEGYRVNAWREETDFTVSATRAGFTCLLTPRTYCYQVGWWSGGQRSNRLRYEFWTARNNWRFLRRHGDWLARRGDIRGPAAAQLRFVAQRARMTVAGATRARWRRLVGRP
jgi:glycosyltransferase involved in cell wall biosynthesis